MSGIHGVNRNSPFSSTLRKYSIRRYERFNGLYEFKYNSVDLRPDTGLQKTKIAIDLSDTSFFHFGDILFFIPLIIVLSKCVEINVFIDENRFTFLTHLLNGYNAIKIQVIKKHTILNCHILITSSYKLLDYSNHNIASVIGLGNLRELTKLRYPVYFASVVLNNYFGLGIPIEVIERDIQLWKNEVRELFVNKSIYCCCNVNSRVVLFAPFVASGKFRDFFGSKLRKLISFAKDLSKSQGAEILLVGGVGDKSTDIGLKNAYDKRGENLLELMALAASDKVICGVGFDNFWMHYLDILGKDYYVKFRGRFSRKGRMLHFKSVNLSFKNDGSRHYL